MVRAGARTSDATHTIPGMLDPTLILNEESLDRIKCEVDPRITDVWRIFWDWERGEVGVDSEFLGWLLRMSYVTGYWEALSEPERGALCHNLGYPVPRRRPDEDGAPAPSAAPRRRACEG